MKIIFFLSCLLLANVARAQLLKVSAGTSLTILGGTVVNAEGLMLTPAADYTISDNTLTQSTTIIHPSFNLSIARVYQFTNNTDPFTGSVQINYTDGAELNGIPEGALTLNVHDGTSWVDYPVATREGTTNFVLTAGVSGISLNELTLADLANPLPLVWLSFTATKQNQNALLQWTTAQEQNTKNFTVQHSRNGINWKGIGTLPAAGNSNTSVNYSYVHTTPVTGSHYYRILQTDIDNRNSYSATRILQFTAAGKLFSIIGNPVSGNTLIVQVNTAGALALYGTDGKLMWQKQVSTGITYIDVSRYAKGSYLLKANSVVQKVILQ